MLRYAMVRDALLRYNMLYEPGIPPPRDSDAFACPQRTGYRDILSPCHRFIVIGIVFTTGIIIIIVVNIISTAIVLNNFTTINIVVIVTMFIQPS